MGRSVSPAPAWRRGPPTAKHRTGRGAKKNTGRPLLVHLGARGGGRPLTAPPAWCQDPLAMCACSRENNPAPNLATLLQGTASTPAVVIDSSPSPGGRGHGRAPDPTRRPPPGAAHRRRPAPRPRARPTHQARRGPVGGFVAGGGGEETWPGPFIAPGAVWRGRTPAGRGRRRGRPPRPLSGPRTGGGTQHGPPRRADTRAGNQRDRIAVQGVAADPSASSAGRAAAVLDEPPRCREPRGARPRHRRARHA